MAEVLRLKKGAVESVEIPGLGSLHPNEDSYINLEDESRPPTAFLKTDKDGQTVFDDNGNPVTLTDSKEIVAAAKRFADTNDFLEVATVSNEKIDKWKEESFESRATSAEIAERAARDSARVIEGQLLSSREEIGSMNDVLEQVGQPTISLPEDNKERGAK